MRFCHVACSELAADHSLEQLLPAAHPAAFKLAPVGLAPAGLASVGLSLAELSLAEWDYGLS